MHLPWISFFALAIAITSSSTCPAQTTTTDTTSFNTQSPLGGTTYDISLSKGRHWFFAAITQQTGSIEFAQPDDSSSNLISGAATTTIGTDTAQETLTGTWYGLDLSFLTLWLVSGTDDTNDWLAYGYAWNNGLSGRAYHWGATQGRYRLEGQLNATTTTDGSTSDGSTTDGSTTNDGTAGDKTSDSGTTTSTNTGDTNSSSTAP